MCCESGSSLPPRPFLFIALSFVSHRRGAFSGFRNLWQTAHVVVILIFIYLVALGLSCGLWEVVPRPGV